MTSVSCFGRVASEAQAWILPCPRSEAVWILDCLLSYHCNLNDPLPLTLCQVASLHHRLQTLVSSCNLCLTFPGTYGLTELSVSCSWYYVKSYAEGTGVIHLAAGIV